MKYFYSFLLLLLLSPSLHAEKNQEISEEQCRTASTEIVKISEEALATTESKKNVKKLEKLIIGWKKRLASNENACDIYQSIVKSSTSL